MQFASPDDAQDLIEIIRKGALLKIAIRTFLEEEKYRAVETIPYLMELTVQLAKSIGMEKENFMNGTNGLWESEK